MGSTLFFTVSIGGVVELWKSNGTSAGTEMVQDINLGTANSNPSSFTAVGSTLFFRATTTNEGAELWTSDGTPAGTVMVKDLNPGLPESRPASFSLVGSTLFFTATTAAAGLEFWIYSTSAPQVITFADPDDRFMSAEPFTVTPTASSGLPVVFSSTTTGVCTVSGFAVTMLTVGTCTLVANQAGNSSYSVASDVTQSFTITTAPTTTTVAPPAVAVIEALALAKTPLVANNLLSPSGEVSVTSGGFVPGEFVQLIVASTPQVIGSGYANAQGVVTLNGNIPASLAAGNHTLALYAPVSGIGFKQPISVEALTLPATGSSLRLWPIMMMLFGGAALIVGTRRRLSQT